MSGPRRVMVVGRGGAGKDTACRLLAEITGLRFAGTTSDYLAKYVAARLDVPLEQARRTRHAGRNLWHRVGNEVRRRDPALLVRESLEHSDITGGIRARSELEACRRGRLVDLIVWIDNERVARGATVAFGPGDCDAVVPNHGGLEDLRANLLLLVRSAGLPVQE